MPVRSVRLGACHDPQCPTCYAPTILAAAQRAVLAVAADRARNKFCACLIRVCAKRADRPFTGRCAYDWVQLRKVRLQAAGR